MDYLLIFLAGLALGVFACLVLYGLMFAHPAQSWSLPVVRREVPPMPSVVAVRVEEGGIEYRFLGGVTGEEQA